MTLPRTLRIRVPASTSNLGPGFDCLGLAFQLYNDFDVEAIAPGRYAFESDGPERIDLPSSPENLFVRAARRFWRRAGPKKAGRMVRMPGFRVRATLRVPAVRGLGSSTTGLLAGLVAANAFAGSPWQREKLLDIAGAMELHPDNATPSLLGGLCAGVMNRRDAIHYARYRVHPSIGCVALVPDYPVPTEKARRAIPARVPHRDAIHNMTRVPLVIDRLVNGRLDDLGMLMEDRLHEPYRKHLLPGFDSVAEAARRTGAAAAVLSGAGSAVVAFGPREAAESVGRAMVRALRREGHDGKFLVLKPDYRGTRVTVSR